MADEAADGQHKPAVAVPDGGTTTRMPTEGDPTTSSAPSIAADDDGDRDGDHDAEPSSVMLNDDGSVVGGGSNSNASGEQGAASIPSSPTTLPNQLAAGGEDSTDHHVASTPVRGVGPTASSQSLLLSPTTYLNQMLLSTTSGDNTINSQTNTSSPTDDLDALLALSEDFSALYDDAAALEKSKTDDAPLSSEEREQVAAQARRVVVLRQRSSSDGEPLLTLRAQQPTSTTTTTDNTSDAAAVGTAADQQQEQQDDDDDDGDELPGLPAMTISGESLLSFDDDLDAVESPTEALRRLRAMRAEHQLAQQQQSANSADEGTTPVAAAAASSYEQEQQLQQTLATPLISNVQTRPGRRLGSFDTTTTDSDDGFVTALEDAESQDSSVLLYKDAAQQRQQNDNDDDNKGWSPKLEPVHSSDAMDDNNNNNNNNNEDDYDDDDGVDVNVNAADGSTTSTRPKVTPSALDLAATDQFLFPTPRVQEDAATGNNEPEKNPKSSSIAPTGVGESEAATATIDDGEGEARLQDLPDQSRDAVDAAVVELEPKEAASHGDDAAMVAEASSTEDDEITVVEASDDSTAKADSVHLASKDASHEDEDTVSKSDDLPSTSAKPAAQTGAAALAEKRLDDEETSKDRVDAADNKEKYVSSDSSSVPEDSLQVGSSMGGDLSVVHEEHVAANSSATAEEVPASTEVNNINVDTSNSEGFLTGSSKQAITAADSEDLKPKSSNSPPSQRRKSVDSTEREEDYPPLPEMSPLSSKPFVRSPETGEVFRSKSRPKALEVEFPSLMDSGLKKSDVVSLSSASSTISHASTARGLLSVSGMVSPGNPEDVVKRRASLPDTLPPRAPKTSETLAAVSMKLTEHENEDEDEEKMETRWIKPSKSASFNPRKSIFAEKSEHSSAPDISPLSSPPEPVYPGFGDDESASSDSQEDATRSSSTAALSFALPPTSDAATWDMIIETDIYTAPDNNRSVRPDYVSGGAGAVFSEDGGTEASVLSESEIGKSSRHSLTRSSLGAESFHSTSSAKRLTVSKMRSFGNRSASLSTSRHSKRNLVPPCASITAVQSEDPRLLRSKRADDQEVLSLDGRRSSAALQTPSSAGPELTSRHSSSPDLLAAEKKSGRNKTVEALSSPANLLSEERFANTTSRSGNKAQLIVADGKNTENLSPDSLADKYDRQVSLCFSEPTKEGSLLEEELLAFSSTKKINVPFRYKKPFPALDYLGRARWRQLVACWKHSEMMQAMTIQDLTPHTVGYSHEHTEDEVWSSSSGRFRGEPIADLKLNGIALYENQTPANTSLNMHKTPSISTFLSEIGEVWSLKTLDENLCHELSKTGVEFADLMNAVESTESSFADLIKGIAAFASRNCRANNAVSFSVDVKEKQAAMQKASRKYNGDLLRVKDVLRSRLCFPDEGTLVCGLCFLLKNTKLPMKNNEPVDNAGAAVELARIKNLFGRKSPLEDLTPSPLPTGYRHVLVNVRFDNGLLGEIQLNLAPLFDILGENGYLLHRELAELEGTLKDSRDFALPGLIEEAVAGFSSGTAENSFLDVIQSSPAENGSGEKLVISTLETSLAGVNEGLQSPSTPESISRKLSETLSEDGKCTSEMETPKAGRSALKMAQTQKGATNKFLKELMDNKSDVQAGDVLLSLLECGAKEASENPRDAASFYCLYVIFSYLIKTESDQQLAKLGFGIKGAADLIEYCRLCLLRCLKISNQALSMGMTGWLEYGSSGGPLDQLTQRPFVLLRNISYVFARRSQWEDAKCVLSALVVLCEQHLPPHHPTILSAMLDLAIASTKIGKSEFAQRLLARSAERLSTYLAKTESKYFSYLLKCRSGVNAVFGVEKGRESLFELQAFISLFQVELSRDMKSLIDGNNEILLTNHCFLADSLSVLANCIAAAASMLGSSTEASTRRADHFWRLAFAHYKRAFDGFAKTKGLADPSASRAAYGIARCLREFGQSEKALELLTIVVSFSKSAPEDETKELAAAAEKEKKEESKDPAARVFLPQALRLRSSTVSSKTLVSKDMSAALCLWLMAILSLDQAPNEEGRERAFSFLHAASVSLQTALNKVTDADDEETKGMCVEFLSMIEDEAQQISEPLYE